MRSIYDYTAPRAGCLLPLCDVPPADTHGIPLREAPLALPQVSESELTRHYTALSRQAFGVDNGFYPLGSCTMKHNPRIHEDVAALAGFENTHPLADAADTQGCLRVLYELQQALCAIGGMDAFTTIPAAGAHGEWTGLQMIGAYHAARGDLRNKVIVPDSAHGTNPASAAMAGFEVVNIPSNPDGTVNVEALALALDETTAALMLTNPNTLGQFEPQILEITRLVHEAGGLLYYDGANLNAIMGVCRPGDMGFDVMHVNLHKTFATPHGGGGPGSGPVGCTKALEPFLPNPRVALREGEYQWNHSPQSIGAVGGFYGNFSVCVKALCYIQMLGGDGLRDTALGAVTNANYLQATLRQSLGLPPAEHCMHEFVLSLKGLKEETGISAKDLAKAMLDCGMHPPTMYFPLLVPEALMFEPTETESKHTMDAATQTLAELWKKAYDAPEDLLAAPTRTPVGRVDETLAARMPVVKA